MILYEEYEDNNFYNDDIKLEFTCFLAEQELFENLLTLGSKVYHESVGLITIHEDFVDTIKTYITKITNGIQQAWNVFKDKVLGFAGGPIIKNARKNIDSYTDGKIVAENWHKYDMTKFNNLKIISKFDSEQDYPDKSEYNSAAFGNVITYDKNKSLKENIMDSIMSTEEKHSITIDDMINLLEFCETNFKEMTTALENDLKNFNTSIKVVQASLNISSTPAETQVEEPQKLEVQNNSADMLLNLYTESCILLEAPGDDKNNASQKLTDTDKGNEKDKNISKKVQWFISGNTDVLTAKMKILRKKYMDALKVLKMAFPMSLKNEKEKMKLNKTEENKEKTQVDI